ncbi:MAG: apolipoprotein N-acyltransferase [Desulfobacterales bacterium]|nr:MAG: apolipoprotein N-acyltransferase [Desulfobacterales bacterium]
MDEYKLGRLRFLLAILSGFLLTMAFPKIGQSWLAWVALVPLLVAIKDLTPKQGFYIGFSTGLAHYLTLVYWLVYTMNTYGHLPIYLCVVILLLLSVYLALYVAVFSMSLVRLCPHPYWCLLMGPLIWVSLEYIRSFLLSGFPWELIGYTQFGQLPIIQIADIFGVYGVSFCILLSNGVIFLIYLFVTRTRWQGYLVRPRLVAGSTVALALIFSLVWFYGKLRIQFIQDLISASPSKQVAIVQGNIDQDKKWDPAFQKASIEKYIKLSLSAKKNSPDLIVWPETATPFYFLKQVELSKMVQKGIHGIGTDFLFGSPSFQQKKNRIEYYNSAFLVNPEGKVYGKYDKAHLVPFGEYVPLKKWLPFAGKMVESVGDFHPGKKGQTLQWGKVKIGIQICYEIIFPNLSRAMAKNRAALLFNITNDAWYGTSSAPYQHFSMAIFRAVENRRSLIRSANTGISGFIDPLGNIVVATPLFQDAVIARDVPIVHETTFYSRYGDVFVIICLVFTSIVVFYRLIRN